MAVEAVVSYSEFNLDSGKSKLDFTHVKLGHRRSLPSFFSEKIGCVELLEHVSE